MSQTIANLHRKINVANDLHKVVRTMKAIASSSIGQYEKSLQSSSQYYRTIELGLGLCLRNFSKDSISFIPFFSPRKRSKKRVGLIIFGSDQGLVGQFNNILATHTLKTIDKFPGEHRIWAIGDRVKVHLEANGITLDGTFTLPKSVNLISPLVSQILIETNAHHFESDSDEIYLIYNHRTSATRYEPISLRLLPLDKIWQRNLRKSPWPSKKLPEIITNGNSTLKALIREFLFVSIFKSCAESLACENISRLMAMQRAEKNITELLENLSGTYHRLRQGNIDEELFDVVSGFEALSKEFKK